MKRDGGNENNKRHTFTCVWNFFNRVDMRSCNGEFRLNGKVSMREKHFTVISEKDFNLRGLIRRMDRESLFVKTEGSYF
jgi:hypothetical protein